MDFLQKIEPYLTTDDIVLQEFVLRAVNEYPEVPAEWTERLLEKAFAAQGKDTTILIKIKNHHLTDRAARLLLEGADKLEKSRLHLVSSLLNNHLEPEIALLNKEKLKRFISNDTWSFYDLLLKGTEEEVWEEYGSVLAELENGTRYNHDLFVKAKRLVKTLVQNGSWDEEKIRLSLKEELREEWFSFSGIFMVYAIGLQQLEEYIPLLASLLASDDDLLLEEVSAALILFQSDKVVEAVARYLQNKESVIFAAGVVENIKSPLAVKVLRNAYKETDDGDDRTFIFEALCHQLSEEALPEVEHFMAAYTTGIIDAEETAYGFYTILNIPNPNLKEWKDGAYAREVSFRKALRNSNSSPSLILSAKSEKVGRNDPCPCGSGKKYKKCCGA
ncbi:zinc chelation protein SecC [Peribacillus cavernae]|uniref:Zinc chelation protein SecC n=1 Tax=Peribacillus cavernae TaxID=1674310 RepID=A0A3S0TTZ8_9BACI|nr:SEC-C metal-binding domain-containing protein [Peribacillus cavernae]MDQ0220997.1 hypothetical protein [Peribacillus cavernae]RUQ27909.1 zinc chelation protein SecC [Peribacillus cavernae]